MKTATNDWRGILRLMSAAGAGFAFAGGRVFAQKKTEEEIAPAEDLMREHGVLNRVLLIYEECLRRLSERKPDLPARALADAARVIRGFIEDYHERLEEEHLFPRFEKARRELELVQVLRAQHRAGRTLTDRTLALATDTALRSPSDRDRLAGGLRQFVRMYRPHEAREDTVLFPALRRLVSRHEYAALGEEFEDEEHRLFGEDGFEKMVDKVAAIEKQLGIYDLAKFTPTP